MLNMTEAKAKLAKIAGLESEDDVKIGFTRKVYEISFESLEEDLTAKQVADIVTVMGEAVVKTIDFVMPSKDTVIISFHMN